LTTFVLIEIRGRGTWTYITKTLWKIREIATNMI
jgi:hypothetical protein